MEVLATLTIAVPCEIYEDGYFFTRNQDKVKPIISEDDLLFYGRMPEKERLLVQNSLRPVLNKSEKAQMKLDKMAAKITKMELNKVALA